MKVIIRGNWARYVGTEYCEALGVYPDLDSAMMDAGEYAWDRWEPDDDGDDWDVEDAGPDYWVEEYDPTVHDGLRAGGGSFEKDFK